MALGHLASRRFFVGVFRRRFSSAVALAVAVAGLVAVAVAVAEDFGGGRTHRRTEDNQFSKGLILRFKIPPLFQSPCKPNRAGPDQ